MPTAWADVLGALLDNATHLKASKACRKALKAAAATSSKSAEALEASLHKFLRK